MKRVKIYTTSWTLKNKKRNHSFEESYTIEVSNPTRQNIIKKIKQTVKEYNAEELARKRLVKTYPVSLRSYGKLNSYEILE